MPDDDDRGESRRAQVRRETRKAGDRSAALANELMKLKDATIAKLELEDDLREAVEEARRVTSPIARRRAERTLAGELRHHDLVELAEKIKNVEETGAVDTRLFHAAEQWRARMLEGGLAAAAEFPGGAADPLPDLIVRAQRERDTGKPPGAQRALFRHIAAVLKAKP